MQTLYTQLWRAQPMGIGPEFRQTTTPVRSGAMRGISKKLAAATLAVGLIGAGAGSGTATAANRGVRPYCVGTRIYTEPVISSDTGKTLGRVELWYSSINGGQNCVMTYDNNNRASAYMRARLVVDLNNNRTADWSTESSEDKGTYTTYAGGAYVNGTNGHCVSILGYVRTATDEAYAYWMDGSNQWQFCG